EVERSHRRNTLKVAGVFGDEHDARLAAARREQDIVEEAPLHRLPIDGAAIDELADDGARVLPRAVARRKYAAALFERSKEVALQAVGLPPVHPRAQFVHHDGAEILERRECRVEELERRLGALVAKRVDEYVRVERVFPFPLAHDRASPRTAS